MGSILQDHKELKRCMYDPQSMGAIMAGVFAANWLNRKLEKWLGEKNAADTLSQSVTGIVTSEMELALLDVADIVHQYPAVMDYFGHARDESFFEDLSELEGGEAVKRAFKEYLEKYGVRCPGEIDITRTRWSEQPTALVPLIMSNIKNFSPCMSGSKFEQGQQKANQKEQEILSRLLELPGGKRKARKTEKAIRVLRNFAGYREYPKYAFIKRYYIYKQALLKEARRLVKRGIIEKKEDIYYLLFDEMRHAVKTNELNYSNITKRKAEYQIYEKLTPPRIITSEGEIITGEYNSGKVPEGALAGIPVSSGIVEGRARIILKWRMPELRKAIFWLQSSLIPAGHRCSYLSRDW